MARFAQRLKGRIPAMKLGASTRNYGTVSKGWHAATLVDINSLGMVKNNFTGKDGPVVLFTWLSDEDDDRGLPRLISRRYTDSLHEKASMRKDLETAYGSDEGVEIARKDAEGLLGRAWMLKVDIKKSANGKEYANVVAVDELHKGAKAPAVHPKFKRHKDRKVVDGKLEGPFGAQAAASNPDDHKHAPEDEEF